jgi:antirestriction protein
MSTTTRRIYVACLASYNAGTLHGAWIDATQGAEGIKEDIAKVLRASPFPNVTVNCPDHTMFTDSPCALCKGTGKVPSAEEFAIHDYEGFGNIKLSEFTHIDDVAAIAEALEEHDGAFEVAYANFHDLNEALDAVRENYCGAYDSVTDYAEAFADDTGMLSEMPENLRCYFDFEAFGRDMELNGDIWSAADSSGQLHVFHNA